MMSVAALALTLGAPAGVQAADAPQARSNPTTARKQMNAAEGMLQDRIYVRLAERAWAGADFDVKVNRGVVTLSGTVPTEQAKRRIVSLARRTPGVMEVREQLRVDPAVGARGGDSPVPDAELSKRVAQKVAGTIAGSKAGEDWWLTGWRVEGPDRTWTMVVEAQDGAVTLDGEVPYHSTIRKAVDAALDVEGVHSVRSEIELEPAYSGYPYDDFSWGRPYVRGVHDPEYFVYDEAGPDAHDFKGVQTLTGEVTKIDAQRGLLTLKTDEGSFELSFPPSSLQDVEQGERISVRLGFTEVNETAASPTMRQERTNSTPPGGTNHTK
jgi:osmotically-inducible protein OsmY